MKLTVKYVSNISIILEGLERVMNNVVLNYVKLNYVRVKVIRQHVDE